MNLTKDDLKAAHVRQDWSTLWLAAIPLAKLSLKRLMEQGRLDPVHIGGDLLQDALLAAGEAVRLWQPDKGAFSTWVMAYIRRRALNSIQAASTGMVGGRQHGPLVASLHGVHREDTLFHEDETQDSGVEALLTYEDPPQGLRDPAEEAGALQAQEWVAAALDALDADDIELVSSLYGIGLARQTLREYATRRGRRLGGVYVQLKRVLNSLQVRLNKASTSG